MSPFFIKLECRLDVVLEAGRYIVDANGTNVHPLVEENGIFFFNTFNPKWPVSDVQ